MIYTHLDHLHLYHALSPLLPLATQYLRRFDADTADGRYELAGKDCFALVQSYETHAPDPRQWEAHRCYVDVQFVFRGEERFGVLPLNQLAIAEAYDAERDILFGSPLPDGVPQDIRLTEGHCIVALPDDAHRPGIHPAPAPAPGTSTPGSAPGNAPGNVPGSTPARSAHVRKIVLKLAAASFA